MAKQTQRKKEKIPYIYILFHRFTQSSLSTISSAIVSHDRDDLLYQKQRELVNWRQKVQETLTIIIKKKRSLNCWCLHMVIFQQPALRMFKSLCINLNMYLFDPLANNSSDNNNNSNKNKVKL